MKRITTRTHGVLDYLTGGLLVLAPMLFDLDGDSLAARIPLALGAITILYSLFTRYELGAIKVIPMRGHLTLDFLNGLFLALSPFIFDFADEVWIPHVTIGAFEILVVMASRRETQADWSYRQTPSAGRHAH